MSDPGEADPGPATQGVRSRLPASRRGLEEQAGMLGDLLGETGAALEARLVEMDELIRQLHTDVWKAAEVRHEHLISLIEGLHADVVERLEAQDRRSDDAVAHVQRHLEQALDMLMTALADHSASLGSGIGTLLRRIEGDGRAPGH